MKKRSLDDPLKMGIKRGQTCDKNDQNQTAKKIALRSFFYTKFVNKSYWKVAHFRPGPLQGQISRIRGSGLGIGFVNIGFVPLLPKGRVLGLLSSVICLKGLTTHSL